MVNKISKATYTSGRLILSVSLLVISSHYVGFELDKLPLLEQGGLESTTLEKIAKIILVVLFFGHLINWLNDQSAYIKETNQETINRVRKDLDKINAMIVEMEKSERNNKARILSNVVSNFKPELYKLKHPLDKLFWFSKISEFTLIYVQHFLVPLFSCLFVFYLV